MSYDVDKKIFKAMLAVALNISTVGYETEIVIFFP